MTQVIK